MLRAGHVFMVFYYLFIYGIFIITLPVFKGWYLKVSRLLTIIHVFCACSPVCPVSLKILALARLGGLVG